MDNYNSTSLGSHQVHGVMRYLIVFVVAVTIFMLGFAVGGVRERNFNLSDQSTPIASLSPTPSPTVSTLVSPATNTVAGTAYTSPAHDFQITLPNGWQATTDSSLPNEVFVSAPASEHPTNKSSLFIKTVLLSDTSAKTAQDYLLALASANSPAQSVTNANGVSGVQAKYSGTTQAGGPTPGKTVVYTGQTAFYQISDTENTQSGALADDEQKIIDSFTLLKS